MSRILPSPIVIVGGWLVVIVATFFMWWESGGGLALLALPVAATITGALNTFILFGDQIEPKIRRGASNEK